jgi:hypothetical protein
VRDGPLCEEEGGWSGSSPATGTAVAGPCLLGGGMGPEVRVVGEAVRWHRRGWAGTRAGGRVTTVACMRTHGPAIRRARGRAKAARASE